MCFSGLSASPPSSPRPLQVSIPVISISHHCAIMITNQAVTVHILRTVIHSLFSLFAQL